MDCFQIVNLREDAQLLVVSELHFDVLQVSCRADSWYADVIEPVVNCDLINVPDILLGQHGKCAKSLADYAHR